MEGRQFRQGDVMLVAVERLPEGGKLVARENGQVVLAHGEATGHAHAIGEAGCALFDVNDLLYLNIETENCVLSHEEHAPIPLPVGVYRVVRQREYTPLEVRYVAD
jgi:hypothetical protein